MAYCLENVDCSFFEISLLYRTVRCVYLGLKLTKILFFGKIFLIFLGFGKDLFMERPLFFHSGTVSFLSVQIRMYVIIRWLFLCYSICHQETSNIFEKFQFNVMFFMIFLTFISNLIEFWVVNLCCILNAF